MSADRSRLEPGPPHCYIVHDATGALVGRDPSLTWARERAAQVSGRIYRCDTFEEVSR